LEIQSTLSSTSPATLVHRKRVTTKKLPCLVESNSTRIMEIRRDLIRESIIKVSRIGAKITRYLNNVFQRMKLKEESWTWKSFWVVETRMLKALHTIRNQAMKRKIFKARHSTNSLRKFLKVFLKNQLAPIFFTFLSTPNCTMHPKTRRLKFPRHLPADPPKTDNPLQS
jgi:hypothetical protein